VREVFALVQSEALIKAVALVLNLADDLPQVSGDHVQLQQVLLNLILNGFDAMEDVPANTRRLTIKTTIQGEEAICVTVQDTGRGFGAVDPERLFEPLYTTKKTGMGMGLAINRSIVHAHGGKIWAQEKSDLGATFQITLPVQNMR